MASILFFLFSALLTATAQQTQLNISRGSFLTPTKNSSWPSRSGLYAFGFYPQGSGYGVGIFIAGIPQKTVVWTANRDNPPVSTNSTLTITTHGKLILQTTHGEQINIGDSSQSISSASMLDSGNFVLYNSSEDIIWQSFDHPTDTLLPGQRLLAGQELFSRISENDHSTGIFRLSMQEDGNLVQYPVQTPNTAPYSYFSSWTPNGGSNVSLNLDADGHLYLLHPNGTYISNLTDGFSSSEETIYMMRIDADGILRLYSHGLKHNGNWSVQWISSNNKCSPKGLCGLNGFCVLNDNDEADCRCIPGFSYVDEGNWTAGCKSNFNAENCNTKTASIEYIMEGVANTWWEDMSYSVLSLTNREDCEKACLEDCNCEAALFRVGQDDGCRKQRLPLRFGQRRPNDPDMAFIKVGVPKFTEKGGISPREGKKNDRIYIIIAGVSLAAFGFAMLLVSGILLYKNHVWSYKRLSNINFSAGSSDQNVAPRSFSYVELEKVTDGFKEEIGRGASGSVYKGILLLNNNQKLVAVKKLDKVVAEGEVVFQNEVKVIGRTHHRNLVRLLGYCIDGANRLLVYEYMSEGSLADVLFTPEKQPCWEERMEFARNIARGILYLHEECETQIIHCDIKPQNILLDKNKCAKISDFGLAKLLKPDQTRTFTGIRGTRGYVAPEWHRKEPVTVKADVYSFGIVLLEIICCRRSVDWSFGEEEAVLEMWVYDCFEAGELHKLVGDEVVNKKQLERMVRVGLWCVLEEPSLRPSMKKVLLMLEGTVEIPVPPNPVSFLSSL